MSTGGVELKVHTYWDFVALNDCTDGSCVGEYGYKKIIIEGDNFKINNNDIIFRFDNTAMSEYVKYDFDFDGTIKQVKETYFGNSGDESGISILALREDGTVGAIYYNYNDGGFRIIQNIVGLNDVVVLYSGGDKTGSDVFAVKPDGSAESVYEYINTLKLAE